MKGSKIFLFFICLGGFFACQNIQNKQFSPKEYIEWFDANYQQFVAKKTIENIEYTLTYLPEDYLFAKQVINNTSLKKDYTNNQIIVFSLRIKAKNGNIQEYGISNIDKMNSNENYFSFGIYKDIYLIHNNNKINSTHVFYQSGRGIAPYIDFIIHFDEILPNEDFQIQFEDKVWDTGRVNFYFKKKNIINRPKLKI